MPASKKSRMLMKFFLTTFFLHSLLTNAQTLLIGKIDNEAIYVGADSRVLNITTNILTGQRDTTIDSMCKIHNYHQYNFATAGKFTNLAISIGLAECAKYNTFQKVVDSFIKDYRNLITDTLHKYFSISEPFFKENFENGVITEMLFFGYESDKPLLVYLKFYIPSPSTGNHNLRYLTRLYDMIFVGHVDAVEKKWLLAESWKEPTPKIIKDLIENESRHSISVGGDVDILKVMPTGIQWISKKKICN